MLPFSINSSSSTSAWYVAQQKKIGRRKVETCWFGSVKWLQPSIFPQDVEVGKRKQQSLTPAVDWLDSLIGPGGLLLVVSHLFAVPVLVLWVGL
jgi:hypothetical protein